jgi:hypothetical protein
MLDEVSPVGGTLPVVIAVLVPLAILVYYFGNIRVQRLMSARNLEPRGRRSPRARGKDDPQFSAMVGRMFARGLVSPIAEAGAGPVMVRGVLTAADSTLGGPPGRECVWQNRSGAPRDAAIAVDYVSVADATGRATIENLALADVVAPEEHFGPHRAYCALRLGDEVEVVARFKPERFGEDPDPTRLVYGTLGADGQLHVRVSRRGPAPAADAGAAAALAPQGDPTIPSRDSATPTSRDDLPAATQPPGTTS